MIWEKTARGEVKMGLWPSWNRKRTVEERLTLTVFDLNRLGVLKAAPTMFMASWTAGEREVASIGGWLVVTVSPSAAGAGPRSPCARADPIGCRPRPYMPTAPRRKTRPASPGGPTPGSREIGALPPPRTTTRSWSSLPEVSELDGHSNAHSFSKKCRAMIGLVGILYSYRGRREALPDGCTSVIPSNSRDMPNVKARLRRRESV